MHEARRADYLAAEHLDDGLVPEAHAEHRDFARERADHVHATRPRRTACPGPGEMHRCVGLSAFASLHRDLVVAAHVDFRAEDQEGLHQVVGEGVVVVDQQQPHVHSARS